jgi:glycosyltransferase involved in cell wall biosynthesis
MQNRPGLHVLILSNPFPGIYQPLEGVFFRDQAFALNNIGIKTGHISVNPVSLKDLLKKGIGNLGLHRFTEERVNSIVYRYVHTPKDTLQPLTKALKKGMPLAEAYIREYGKPDIVHLHRFESGLLAMELKKKFGIPFVITEHSSRFLTDSIPEKQMRWAKEIFSAGSLNIAVSKSLQEKLEKLFGVRFHYLPNLTDTSFFQPANRSGQPRFLSVGNLTRNKNQALAIEAFNLWFQKHGNGQLIIIGSGPEEKQLKSLAGRLGISEKVHFTGQISRSALADQLRQSTCLLITSRHETFGVVAIEALSSGLPVISTRCGGPESIISNGVHGYFTSFMPEDVAQHMELLLQNGQQFPPEALHHYAVNEFSRKAVAEKLQAIYQEILTHADIGD